MGYDLIGDIHGEAPTLRALLEKLGYQDSVDGYAHPDGRTAIFVGDLVDRGLWQREVIQVVCAMTESGNAMCVMGNHEFNAIAYATPDQDGRALRRHSEKNTKQHKAFLDAYLPENETSSSDMSFDERVAIKAEYDSVIAWFKTLPLWVDLPELRVIHACWDQKEIDFLHGRHSGPVLTDELLFLASTFGTKEYRALETLLKGKEIALPNGAFYHDKEGTLRTVMRTKWWGEIGSYRDCYMGPEEARENIPDEPIVGDPLVHYPADDVPVFIGHYWLDGQPLPLAENIACLDYSVARPGGSLVAYRFDGEPLVDASKFVSVQRLN